MKKLLIGFLAILLIAWSIPVFAQDYMEPRANNFGRVGDADRNYQFGYFQRLQIPEMTAPTGNPATNYGWLYVKDNAGASALYFEDDAGTVTLIGGSTATEWDDIADPSAAGSVSFGNFGQEILSTEAGDDTLEISVTAAFGAANSILQLTHAGGDATGGALLYGTTGDDDVTGIALLNSTADIANANYLLLLDYTDSDDTDGYYIMCRDNAASESEFSVRMDGSVVLGGVTGSGALQVASPTNTALTLAAEDASAASEDVIITGNNISVDATGNTVLGGTLSVASTLTFSGASDAITSTSWSITDAGNISTAGTFTFSGADDAITATNWSITNAGAATFVSLTAGTVLQNAVAHSAAGGTLTLNGNTTGGVTIGGTSSGTITLGGGTTLVNLPATVNLTLVEGEVSITSASNAAAALGIVNNTVTTQDLVTISSTSATSGEMLKVVAGANYSGSVIYAQATDATFTGKYIQCYDAAADDFTVSRYGATVIAGNATGTAALTITAGDLVISDGKLTQDGGAVLLNHDSNFTVGIGTGTNNQAISIGGGSNTVAINSSDWDIDATGIVTGIASIAMDPAASNITITTNGAADDFSIILAGATDSTLALSSTGTGADALTISTSAGGIDITIAGATANEDLDILTNSSINITATEAVVGQIALSAQGTVAGNAITIATTDGGLDINAAGAANGDVTITAADAIGLNTTGLLTLTSGSAAANGIGIITTDGGITITAAGLANGDLTLTVEDDLITDVTGVSQNAVGGNLSFTVTGTGAIDTSDWDISTTGAVTKLASVGFDSGSVIYVDNVEISSAEILALRATPKTLVTAPGINKFVEVISVVLILDYGTVAYTVDADDDLVVEYAVNGDDITASLECTGFLDQAADTMKLQSSIAIAAIAAANVSDSGVRIKNTGVGELTAGDGTMSVKISYRVHTDGL